MERIGIRELRQNPSALIRRVEAGEEIEITVSGRTAARLVPPTPRQWVPLGELKGLFEQARPYVDENNPDPRELDPVDQSIQDPWQ